jgi:fibro-slime domain-containing protein
VSRSFAVEIHTVVHLLGPAKGNTYPLDLFSAGRHVTQSNLLIATTLGLTTNTNIPIF